METVNLDLSTMEGLNEEVRKLFRTLSESMGEDDTASIGISINMERVQDTDTMLKVTYKVKPTYPSKSRQIIAHAALIGNLTVEATPTQMNMFPKSEVVANG